LRKPPNRRRPVAVEGTRELLQERLPYIVALGLKHAVDAGLPFRAPLTKSPRSACSRPLAHAGVIARIPLQQAYGSILNQMLGIGASLAGDL